MKTRIASLLVPIVAALTVVVPAVPAGARSAADRAVRAEEHCVIDVVGQKKKNGEFIVSEPQCYDTFPESAAAAGLDVDASARSVSATDLDAAAAVAALSGTTLIGVHWDGANRTGSSILVRGADCLGGYLNLSSTWINRISSTSNFCPVVRFFDDYDMTGYFEQTGPGAGNLGALNNLSNSISYGS